MRKPAKVSIPFGFHGVDEIGNAEIQAVTRVLKRKKIFRFLSKPEISETSRFEAGYRRMTGAKYALAVNGGTSALIAALKGLGVGAGDEVIIPGYTYIATASAVIVCNAIPVIAEIDRSLTLDPKDFERKITRHTRAVIPVHMRGTPSRMKEILAIAKKHKLKVLEDVAQANGGKYGGRFLGSLGDAGIFSFQHYKVITAGEGGMVITSDKAVYARTAVAHDSAMHFWDHGFKIKAFAGENLRMDDVHGAIGLVQLGRLNKILSATRKIKARILAQVKGIPGLDLQDVPDPKGDCGISVVFLLGSADRAKRFAGILGGLGVGAGTIWNKGIPDRHIYTAWDYVLRKDSGDRTGHPWACPLYKGKVSYSHDMCPRTLDILGQSVSIYLHQKLNGKHADQIAEAVRWAAGQV